MPNHYHLLAETTEANLSQAMQWLNVSYTVWFNRRHQRVGHLFQGRFKSVIVEPETWALGLSRYIHLNPVRVRQLALDKAAQRRQGQGMSQKPSPQLVQQRSLCPLRQSARLAVLRAVLSFGGGRPEHCAGEYRR